MARHSLRTLDMAYIALFAVLMAICAWISIPLGPVPFTLQTFALFLALTVLGGRRGFYAVAVYLLLGAVGLPVFSGFQGGPGILLSAGGGFLIGFLFAALFYRLTESLLPPLFACLGGLITCYAFGVIWYLFVYADAADVLTALRWCVLPFALPDLLKLALALTVSRRLRPLLQLKTHKAP